MKDGMKDGMDAKRAAPWTSPLRKAVGFQAIDFNTSAGSFSGYAARFGNLDQTGDVIEPGAFTKTLQEAEARRTAQRTPFLWTLLYMHDPEKPIGGVTLAREDSKGLYIEGVCDLNTALGRSVFSGMKTGYLSQFSIGYDAVRSSKDQAGVRHLREIRLWEISSVTGGFAANPDATLDLASVKTAPAATRPASALAGQLQPVLETMLATMTRDMKSWTAGRGVYANADDAADEQRSDDPPPTPASFRSHDAYVAAHEAWEAAWYARKYGALLTPPEGVALDDALRAQAEARIRNGQAKFGDLWDYAATHGHTPDGRALPDDAEGAELIARARRAALARAGEED